MIEYQRIILAPRDRSILLYAGGDQAHEGKWMGDGWAWRGNYHRPERCNPTHYAELPGIPAELIPERVIICTSNDMELI